MFKNLSQKLTGFILIFLLSLFQNQFFVGDNVSAKDYDKIENGVYIFVSALDNNKVVDIKGSSSEDMTTVQLYESNRSFAQTFYVIKNDDGSYRIEAVCSGKVLDVQYGCKEPGTKVWQYESNGTDAQKWYFESAGNGYYYVVSKLSGLNLDVAYGKAENGTHLWTYTPNFTDAQKFKPEKPYVEEDQTDSLKEKCEDKCTISDDKSLMQPERIKELLSSEPTVYSRFGKKIETLIDESHVCLGAYDENGVQIGFMRAVLKSPTVCYVGSGIVDESYRGKGIGTELMRCILKNPFLVGCTFEGTSSPKAKNLWKKFGFREILDTKKIVRFRDLSKNQFFTVILKNKMEEIRKIVDASSCFENVDGMVRKSRNDRIRDIISWYKKYKLVNDRYNDYGLDIKNFRDQDDFFEEREHLDEVYKVHHSNINPHQYTYYNHKFEFYKMMLKNNLASKTPKINYIVNKGEVIYPENKQNMSTSAALKSLKSGKYICKPQYGAQGNGVYLIEKKNGDVSFYKKNSKKSTSDDFYKNIHDRNYMFQDYVIQHKKINNINPHALNTVRIVTTRYNNEPQVLGAMLRVGVNKSIIDNVHSGGTCIGINQESGKLKRYGCYYSIFNKKIELEHPVSHVKYDGYQLPYWQEVLNLVKTAHKIFYGLSSIGWDVAITENGPQIIEINSGYGLRGLQAVHGGLKEKWFKLKRI